MKEAGDLLTAPAERRLACPNTASNLQQFAPKLCRASLHLACHLRILHIRTLQPLILGLAVRAWSQASKALDVCTFILCPLLVKNVLL